MPSREAPSAKPQVGALDDRYELLEPIGSGGMAQVWKARDRRLGRDVAVKLLPEAATRDPSNERRIEREARALAALSHPNILAVYDSSARGETPFLVSELVDGPDLAAHLAEKGKLPVGEALGIARDVLGAVGAAHTAGVVHGDLKAANILMSDHGPKVGDFGVARLLAEETGATTLAATPSCAAPEVFRGARPTPASDLYSAGCVLFEMLAGRPPYRGKNGWELATRHLEDAVPSVRQYRHEVPVEIDEAIRRAMSKDPKKRFRSAEDFADALAVAPSTVPMAAPPPPPTERPPTEVLTAPKNTASVAVLGPFAGLWHRIRDRRPVDRTRTPIGRIVVVVGVLLLLLVLLFSVRGGNGAVVPDVRGDKYQAASALLRQAGFHVKDVSFREVRSGQAGVVLETVPSAGKRADRGSDVYLIASVLAPTPTPAPAKIETPKPPAKGHGRKHHNEND